MDSYNTIITKFNNKDININIDNDFRRIFNTFYRVRRNSNWQNIYYEYFEQNKNNKSITFDEILDYLYNKTGNIEASFSSKMLSTINPNMPIWDQYVLKNLGLKVDGITKEEKLENTKRFYKMICEDIYEKLNDKCIQETIKKFRSFFKEYNFSDVKILDFILWNNR